ncbi:MAG TPA: nicotinate phosphoribosyltransferase [Micromonosporaceae bacterium]
MLGLCTDLYELRMAASYLRRGMVGPATFSLFVRHLPAQRGFLVAAGLAEALEFLDQFTIDDDELDYLIEAVGLDHRARSLLRGVRFSGDVWAVPEGRVVFADEPLLEVTAPIAEAQLVETALLNVITFATTVASKAARCRLAAAEAELIDFSFRRTQGISAGMTVARASAIAGFDTTSNVAAARRYHLRPAGTMAHSFVEAFADERAAFRAFAHDYPQATFLLVDTYDTLTGVRRAIEVAEQLELDRLGGIRLDSGDLGELAIAARRLLDQAGRASARIVASGGLDEYSIADLVARRAPIDAYGIGTRMGVSADAPSLDSAYKLVCFADRPVMKLSEGKLTQPGAKQVYRDPVGTEPDLLALREEPAPPGWEPLLRPVMRAGRRLASADPAGEIQLARQRFESDLTRLNDPVRRLVDPRPAPVRHSEALGVLRGRLIDELTGEPAGRTALGGRCG